MRGLQCQRTLVVKSKEQASLGNIKFRGVYLEALGTHVGKQKQKKKNCLL